MEEPGCQRLSDIVQIFFLIFLMYVCMYLFMAVLGLRFCARTFSNCSKWGPLFIAVRGPLTIAASRCGAQAPDAQAQYLWFTDLVAPQHVGIFPDQGSNPCPLHWQADSQPLRHQGSPHSTDFNNQIAGNKLILRFLVMANELWGSQK